MKSLCFVLAAVSMSPMAFAQTEAQEPMAHSEMKTPAPTEAQKAFDKLKTLAGPWEGHLNVVPPVPGADGKVAQVAFRVASRGHTLMHDLKLEGVPDNPLTMLVVDADRLLLTHYCDADNRPRMIGKASPDGRRWSSIFSTSPATSSTDTCIMRCSPSSTRTTTPRTGPS